MDKFAGVIFDCDGVMFNSCHANLAYYNMVLHRLGEPLITEDQTDRIHLCHTGSSPQVYAGLLGQERLQEALSVAATIDYDQFIAQLLPEPGLVEVLAELSRQLPLAVATNRGSSMVKILKHFELTDYFSAVVTHQDVARPKPYPDMLFEVAQRLRVQAEHLAFVGDSVLDQRAAGQAGCRFVSYQWDGGQRIDHHHQLLQLINR